MKIDFSIWSTFFNLPLVLGMTAYGFGAIFMLLSFKQGELSVLFPILATSYVWVSILSPIFFPDDAMNPWKWFGVAVIIASVIILGLSAEEKCKPLP
jgi:multidrug transporter EmrE-like cation transporter